MYDYYYHVSVDFAPPPKIVPSLMINGKIQKVLRLMPFSLVAADQKEFH